MDGKKHGIGDYYFKNGDKYKGSFIEDERYGKGTMTYVNNDKFHG